MKVVINTQYGGFGLSLKAVMEYARLKGITLYPFIDDISKKVYRDKATLDNPSIPIHYILVPEEEYEKVLAEENAKPVGIDRYKRSNALYFSDQSIPRNDLDLIRIVEEMKGKANGSHATLKIVTIPNNVKWQIEEYDGNEWIAEEHRRWE